MDEILNLCSEWISNHEQISLVGDAVLFLLFLVSVLYLLLFTLASLKKRKDTYPPARVKYRFAILFPAYNEDAVILDSVRSFLQQEYPRANYDLFVLSDHMSEETDRALIDLSAIVVNVNHPKSTKVHALQAGIHYIDRHDPAYDIVLVMDADNVVNIDYLNKLNDAFYSGCSAVQTHRVAKNRDTNIAILDAVSEEINNAIFRKGHTQLGFSSALIGSGMAFEYDLFRDITSHVTCMGIDKQLEKSLLAQNIYIEYLEHVLTYDEKVKGRTGFYNQRRRWIANQFSNLSSGLLQLPAAILRGNWDYCDKLFQWMMPPRIILFGFIVLFACFFSSLNFAMSLKWWGLLFLLCVTFCLAVPDYLVDKRFTKALSSIPILFILMFFNLFRIRGANKEFIHTQHSNTTTHENRNRSTAHLPDK